MFSKPLYHSQPSSHTMNRFSDNPRTARKPMNTEIFDNTHQETFAKMSQPNHCKDQSYNPR
ncbi:MAG: hypothetical protein CL920_23910 [Deltaproteobacteria bacterium]|nr:hypothetical protein [Deltaproteobacteria bacterium]